jgi:biopolymer transport protein ExbB/biopolymer transport protein TolQ
MQFSIIDLWLATGPVGRLVVLTLLGLSMASISVGTERLLALRRARKLSTEFLTAWRAREERPWSGVVDVAQGEADTSPAAILLRGLGAVLDQGMPLEIAEKAYDRTTRRLLLASAAQLRRGLGFLATVGSTAPFIGLFGTVLGIVNAFAQMASTGQGGLAVVAGGIAEALVTTALGILAAIPALWMFNSLSGGIAALMTEIECAAEELACSAFSAEYASGSPPARLVRRASGGRSDAR